MLKLSQVNNVCVHLLWELPLIRHASSRLHRPVQIQHRLSFRTQSILRSREDDLSIAIDSVGDPSKVQSVTALWNKEELLQRIDEMLNCNREDLERVYKVNKKALKSTPPKVITDNIRLLLEHGVSEISILNHPKLLSHDTVKLAAKLQLLKNFKSLEDINHLAPFLNIDQYVLEKIVQVSQTENIEHGNRLYFLEAKTGVDVEVISRYFANSARIYSVALHKFQQNLDYCLQHLEPIDVVKHLSILAFANSSIAKRMQMLKGSLQKVKPWMIRVPNLALEKSFEQVIEKGLEPSFDDPVTGLWFEQHVLKRMQSLLDCTREEARDLYDACNGDVSLLDNIELLLERNVRKDIIFNNPAVLTSRRHELTAKLATLDELKNLRDINDMAPLCALKPYQVKKIVHRMNSEKLPSGNNRIYQFADQTGIQPAVATKQFARRTFMFRISKKCFVENLEQFITHMDPQDILADLWAFKYSPEVVEVRLARARQVRGKKLMPWMVRCPDVVLEKSLQLTKENGDLLGENDTIVEYLCKRLGFEPEVIRSIFLKLPSIQNVRVTKVKKVIDYLLEELDYTPQDLALNPRILMHSLQTTKKRMEHLKEIGCRPRSLVIVCKSQRQYDAFVKEWLAARERKMLGSRSS